MGEEKRETPRGVSLKFKAVNREYTGDKDVELLKVKSEYEEIWNMEGERVIKAMERVSGFSFRETEIEVRIWRGRTYSGRPFQSAMNLGIHTGNRRAILTHELLHRLHDDYGLEVDGKGDKEVSENNHRILYLNLKDVWTEIYGEEFAQKAVEEESRHQLVIDQGEMWDEVLTKFPTVESRREEFERIKNQAV